MFKRADLRLLGFLLLPAGLSLAVTGCGRKGKGSKGTVEEASEAQELPLPEAPKFVAAFLYNGAKNDDGYNQAHAAGAAAVAQQLGVKVIEEENVPEGLPAGAAIEKVIKEHNARVVFPTAMGFFDATMQSARKHANTRFLHCGGYYEEGQDPANAGSFNAYLDEGFYVSGMVAAMTSKTGRLGFVAGTNTPHALRNINAFTLGARSVSAKTTTEVVFTGEWSNAEKELKAANQLFPKGIDVLAMYVGSPKVLLQAAERRGIYSVGVHVDGSKHAPKGYLTGVEVNWTKMYNDYVTQMRLEKKVPNLVRGGFMEGYVGLSRFGAAVSEAAQRKASEARAQIAMGKLVIFKGPLYDNRGRVVLPPTRQLIQRDIKLEKTSYLVEGVIGKLPG